MLWNQFSNEAKLATSVPSFKKLIRKWLGLDKLYIFIVVNLISSIIIITILADIIVIVMINIIIINNITIVIYIRLAKRSNSRTNEETSYAGYYIDKNTQKNCYFSNF